MYDMKCGKIIVTEHGDFSFLCLKCEFISWKINEFKDHVLDIHMIDYFGVALDQKKFLQLDINEINECIEQKSDLYIESVESTHDDIKATAEILSIEKLKVEYNDQGSDFEEKYEYGDEATFFYDTDDGSNIKIEIEKDNKAITTLLHCNDCNENFENIKFFNKHKLRCRKQFCPNCLLHITGNVTQHIDECKFEYDKKESLGTKEKSTPKSLSEKSICKYCDRIFYIESAFRKHMLIHETNSDKCEYCGKRFRTLDSLRNHIRRHKGERPFKCSVCASAFNDKINLKTHYIVRHTEGLKIPCGYKDCDRIFKTVELRKRHERYVHNTDSNYLCLSCGMRFKTSSKLNEHSKKKHLNYEDRPFECEYCTKKFIFLQDLKNHKMTHTGEKPFKCDLCTKAFIKKYELTKHIRKKHNDSEFLKF